MMSKTVIQAYEAGEYEIISQFFSKKNKVQLIRLVHEGQAYMLIKKKFTRKKSLEQEMSILDDLKNKSIKTVKCYGRFEDVLLYEYIDSMTLCEFLEQAEPQDAKSDQTDVLLSDSTTRPFRKAINWLASFHDATGLAFYDCNLRNFLVTQEDVMAIDFEDSREVAFAEDYGRFLAFILTYTPSFTPWKKLLVRQLEEHLNNNINECITDIYRAKERELIEIGKRRSGNEKGI
ncbi:hypothetical protein Q5O14_13550 [Eubacteriaceae bacterium ES2]|nr:hypothetical protein Q5O14_13550 [Eubacteriaceae bacterium ES2]